MQLRDVSAREEASYGEDTSLSPCLDHLPAGRAAGLARAPASAVFLHTSWRSGGTWIWSRCRDSARVCGFYEPLHEQAARFRRRDVSIMRPGSWQSNHSETAPYFEEYRALIARRGRGVGGYEARFAFDDFFRAPNDPADPALEAYLAALLASPPARGKMPVLKFCRSLGRVGWLENRFPNALHLVVLRDPLAQFASIQHLLERQRNRYFALAPLLVLARNAAHPAVRLAAGTLGVSLPALHSPDMDYAVETCWRHVRRIQADERYRGFLAFWTLCAISALDSEAAVIDIDTIGADPAQRLRIEAALRGPVGEAIKLVPRRPSPTQADPDMPPPGMQEAHLAARSLLRAHASRLTPDRYDLIAMKLATAGGRQIAQAVPPYWAVPPMPATRRGHAQRLLTSLAVGLARGVQPLRRLHGAFAWRKLG